MAACADDSRKAIGAGCDIWGERRLALAVIVKSFLNGEGGKSVPWFIESGTLLGAWRSGKFIPHDDDFDIGVCLPSWSDVVADLEELRLKLSKHLPEPYKCRLVDSYCDKLEVFDPTQGSYLLLGPQYMECFE